MCYTNISPSQCSFNKGLTAPSKSIFCTKTFMPKSCYYEVLKLAYMLIYQYYCAFYPLNF